MQWSSYLEIYMGETVAGLQLILKSRRPLVPGSGQHLRESAKGPAPVITNQ